MIYCPKCGVSMSSKKESCPLCGFSIASIPGLGPLEEESSSVIEQIYPKQETRPKKTYQRMSTREKQKLGLLITGFVFVLPIAITLAIDLAVSRRITWSIYVIFPVSFISLSLMTFFLLPRKPIVGITITLALFFLLEFVLNLLEQTTIEWNMNSNIELWTLVIIELLSIYIIYLRRGWVSIVNGSFLAVGVYLLGLDFLIDGFPLRWSLIPALIMGVLISQFTYSSVVHRKGLNIVGWAFFMLTIFLFGLNVIISKTLDWSWITFSILMPIAICSFLLHFFWFRDIDWKKALHL